MPVLDSSLSSLAEVIDRFVDPRVGIIRLLEEVPRDAGEPNFFRFWANACNVEAFSDERNFARGGGSAADRDSAIAKAIGEAVERYCSALYEVEELPLASYDGAPFPCTAPGDFALFSGEQYESPGFPYLPFGQETPVRWAPAIDATTGEERHVPAAFVYVPYYFYQGSGDTPIAQPISTGLACHVSPLRAAVSAICEVIERDAFTITWQARLSRPRIPLETLPTWLRRIAERFTSTGYSVTLLDITMDSGVPTILGVLRGHASESAQLVTAAATSLDPAQAAKKALEELDHTRGYCQRLRNELPRLPGDPAHANVIDQQSHLNFWCDSAHVPFADFLTASEATVEFQQVQNLGSGDPRADLATLVERVTATGHRVLLADLTTPDVVDAGLAVARAVVPGYHPLVVGHRFRALGGYRLWEIPQRIGYEGIDPAIGDNPYPHPYP